MTHKLYYDDPLQTEFDARVTDVSQWKGKYRVVLDRTCFYPEGGGQPADTGFLSDIPVVDVRKEHSTIYHITEQAPPADEVHGRVDGQHRRDYMQQHTGQHIISGAMMEIDEIPTISVHQGEEYTTIEVERSSLDGRTLEAIEDRANAIIAQNRAVNTFLAKEGDVPSLGLRRPPKVSGEIRIVEIDEFDRVACGGVHTVRTGDVRLAKLVGTETIRGNVRTAWKIGDRAFRDYRQKSEIVAELNDLLSAQNHEITERIRALQENHRQVEYKNRALESRIAALMAQELAERADKIEMGRIVTGTFHGEDKNIIRKVVESLVEHENTYAAIVNIEAERVLWSLACSPELSVDFNVMKDKLLPVINGKGGGRHPIWQGAGSRLDSVAEFHEEFKRLIASGSGRKEK